MAEWTAHEIHDAIANLLEDATRDAVAVQKVVTSRLHEGFGKEDAVREGRANSLPLAYESSNVVTNLQPPSLGQAR